MTTPEERTRIITAARSICWEAYGASTEGWTDMQCIIRASAWVNKKGEEEAGTFLDLAEELAGEGAHLD